MKIYVKTGIFALAFLGFVAPAQAGDIEQGKAVFDQLCIHCHKLNYDEKFAPGLAGITERRDEQWLHDFLKNPSEMIRNDEYAKNLKENNVYNLTMPAFSEMQDEQKRANMIAYLSTLHD